MKRKIYHILPEDEPFSEFHGGAISRWAANIVKGDRDVVIVCPWADESWGVPSHQVHCSLPYKLYGQQKWSRGIAWRSPTLLRMLLRSLLPKLRAADLVWIHSRPKHAETLMPYVRGRGASLVLHMHNSLLRNRKGKNVSAISTIYPDKIVFVSKFMQEEAKTVIPSTIATDILYNGADDAMFHPDRAGGLTRRPDVAPTVLFTGRVAPEKGVHVLIQAMRLLLARGFQAKAVIVGTSGFGNVKASEYFEHLRTTAPENVEFRGYCTGSQLADCYRQADIYCFPSTWNEPFALVNAEAMATGLPVVATNVGGTPEMFRDGGAILVPPNSAEQLADALERLVVNPGLRAELGREGYASFNKSFRWSTLQQRYRSIAGSL